MEKGDYVKVQGQMDSIFFKGEIGIISYCDGYQVSSIGVTFPYRFNTSLHSGIKGTDHTKSSYNIIPRFLTRVSKEEYDFMWKDVIKKKEDYKLLHQDIDPYGEEEWEFENLKSFDEFIKFKI